MIHLRNPGNLRGLAAVSLVGLLVGGCAQPETQIPTSIMQYEQMPRSDRQRFPVPTVVAYNLQRARNTDLPPADRVNSLRLATGLAGDDPQLEQQVAAVLTEGDSTPQLRRVALEFLLSKDHPGLGGYVVKLLPRLEANSPLRDSVLDWLIKHPQPEVLAEVVKLWAAEPSATGPNEPRFRRIVETMTGTYWDQALLDALNSPGFFARGSAIEILTSRASASVIRSRIGRMNSRTEAFAAMKTFLERFGYVPQTAENLLQTVWIYTQQRDLIPTAARLAQRWEQQYGYRFNIRDFHLLSRLELDPLRTKWRSSQLIEQLRRVLDRANHIHHRPSARGAIDDYPEGFAEQVAELTMTDLWNIYLLREMLGRTRIQMALRITAQRDREDTEGAWGGLVFYENGQAEAKLYPYSPRGGDNDLLYFPGRQAVIDGRDALARFVCHVERVNNADRAGPGPEELRRAEQDNHYGLVITSVSENIFCAHYYNPDGRVVSLGTFPFR